MPTVKKLFKRKNKRKNSRNLMVLFFLLITLPLVVFQVLEQQNLKQEAQAGNQPNFIVIMTDDQPWNEMETLPTVTGRLASRGITFSNAYFTTSLCCPSRASFLSGLYSHNTGVWDVHGKNALPAFLDNDDQTIATWLQGAGYKTALVGKYLNGIQERRRHRPPGWNLWYVFLENDYYNYEINHNGKIKKFGNKNKDYSTNVLRNQAVNFIKNTKEPFFLLFTPYAPHSAGRNENNKSGLGAAIPAPRLRGRGNCTVSPWQIPPSFNEQDVSDKPQAIRKLPKIPRSEAERFRKTQLCSLITVDLAISDMLTALGPRIDNTVIIFLTDNGYSYGQHRYIKKHCFYEECARTPLVISYPKLFNQAETTDELVQQIDLAPTIAELAGVTIPVPVNGKSLVPLFTDPRTNIRDYILMEQKITRDNSGSAIRSDQYKYIERATGEKELYDLINDPYEMQSQHTNPNLTATMQELSSILAEMKME